MPINIQLEIFVSSVSKWRKQMWMVRGRFGPAESASEGRTTNILI